MPAGEPSYVCISASRSRAPERGSMGPCPGGKFGQHRSAPPRRRAGCTPTRKPREGRCNPGCNQARRSAPRQAGRWAARAAARRSPPETQGTRTAAPGSRTWACNPGRWEATARRAPRDCLPPRLPSSADRPGPLRRMGRWAPSDWCPCPRPGRAHGRPPEARLWTRRSTGERTGRQRREGSKGRRARGAHFPFSSR